eukprot:4885477-Alexandrium_andersonii.AAC.1
MAPELAGCPCKPQFGPRLEMLLSCLAQGCPAMQLTVPRPHRPCPQPPPQVRRRGLGRRVPPAFPEVLGTVKRSAEGPLTTAAEEG